jgi:hypothetical protein
MKIIQISTSVDKVTENRWDDEIRIFGLGDDGLLYEHVKGEWLLCH